MNQLLPIERTAARLQRGVIHTTNASIASIFSTDVSTYTLARFD